MKSNFVKDVVESHPLLSYVLSVHLHVERWLRELLSMTLPNPEVLLKEARFSFLDSVILCQALNILDDDLAVILKKLNTLRNKFAHVRSFSPAEEMIEEFLASLRDMKNPFYIPLVDPNEGELARALASVCGRLEKLVNDSKPSNKDAPNNSFNRSAG